MEGNIDVRKLADLLRSAAIAEENDDVDSHEEEKQMAKTTISSSPGNICLKGQQTAAKPKKKSAYDPLPVEANPSSEEFFQEELLSTTEIGWKKKPEYEISYKQSVTPSDVFLQMGAKTTASASCEDMLVKICLPGEKTASGIDLKITDKRLKLISIKYKLDLALPQPVDPKMGHAEWDPEKNLLTVSLRMDRDLDFVNF